MFEFLPLLVELLLDALTRGRSNNLASPRNVYEDKQETNLWEYIWAFTLFFKVFSHRFTFLMFEHNIHVVCCWNGYLSVDLNITPNTMNLESCRFFSGLPTIYFLRKSKVVFICSYALTIISGQRANGNSRARSVSTVAPPSAQPITGSLSASPDIPPRLNSLLATTISSALNVTNVQRN